MFESLIHNFTTLTTFLFFGNMLRTKYLMNSSLKERGRRIVLGLALGFFGVVHMYFTFPLTDNVFADFRQLPILISVYLGGFASGGVATLIISIYRMFFLDGVNQVSIFGGGLNAVFTLIIALLFIRFRRLSFKRWLAALLLSILASDIAFYFTLEGEACREAVMIFSIVVALGGIFTYSMLQYLERSGDSLRILSEAAHRDFLTGLYNARAFEVLLQQKIDSFHRYQIPFTLLMVDIDHFKKVNDTYGHAEGDAVLTQIANLLRDTFRPGDEIARKGGEEFVIIVDSCDREQIVNIAERLRRNVESEPFLLPQGLVIHLTISAGSATYPDIDKEQLLDMADQALYKAKESGRNQVWRAER
ncbi:diguanylate cyclase [Paenibacillus bouchesdurhonensis]|uniref:diguanylate cyclase n=1 Tax=Paenibacillus bouchesdurhonensis TaxID=1870990 RepID=UPI000DA633F6|nr:diguanylate cyclase [Paenibacillus bouchesdurhonensis]